MTVMELFGASALDTSAVSAHPGRLYNLWADRVADGGRTRRLLRSVPGMTVYHNFAASPVRALFRRDDELFAVAGGTLARRTAAGANAVCGAVAASGTADIARNGTDVVVAAGDFYYRWNGTTLSTPSIPITTAASVSFLAGRTIVTSRGQVFCWSDVAAPGTFPGLNVATAEQRDDDIVRGMVSGGVLFLFGERSIEMWAPDSFGAAAFGLIGGGVIDRGLKGFNLIQPVGGGFFFVGDDDISYLMGGSTLRAVSIAAVNTALKAGTATSCEYWEDRGHKFCAIVFSDRPAWVFDLTTEEWFERGEGAFGVWRAARSVEVDAGWIVGAADGQAYTLAGMTDAGAVLRRVAVSYPLYNDGAFFTFAELEIFSETGTAGNLVTVETSRNRRTWGNARTQALFVGRDDGEGAIFRQLGRAKDMTARLTLEGAVDVPIYADARVRLA